MMELVIAVENTMHCLQAMSYKRQVVFMSRIACLTSANAWNTLRNLTVALLPSVRFAGGMTGVYPSPTG